MPPVAHHMPHGHMPHSPQHVIQSHVTRAHVTHKSHNHTFHDYTSHKNDASHNLPHRLGPGHVSIVRPRELLLTKRHLGFAMEYVGGGTIEKLIQTNARHVQLLPLNERRGGANHPLVRVTCFDMSLCCAAFWAFCVAAFLGCLVCWVAVAVFVSQAAEAAQNSRPT